MKLIQKSHVFKFVTKNHFPSFKFGIHIQTKKKIEDIVQVTDNKNVTGSLHQLASKVCLIEFPILTIFVSMSYIFGSQNNSSGTAHIISVRSYSLFFYSCSGLN